MCAKQTGKIYYSMGEVTEMFDVNPSLIRFWESKFDVLKPHKNKKGNRMFTPADVENLKLIYHLVKEKGMTLEGARKMIKSNREGINRDLEVFDRLLGIKALLSEIKQELSVGADFESDPDEEYIPDSTSIIGVAGIPAIKPEELPGAPDDIVTEEASPAYPESVSVQVDSENTGITAAETPEPIDTQEISVAERGVFAGAELNAAETGLPEVIETPGEIAPTTEGLWPEELQEEHTEGAPAGAEPQTDEVITQPATDIQEDTAGFTFASDELDMMPDDFGFSEEIPDDGYVVSGSDAEYITENDDVYSEPATGEDIPTPESAVEASVAEKPISEQVQQIVSQNITEIAGEEFPKEYIEQLSDEIAEEAATAAEVMEALAELDKAEDKKQGPTVYEQTLF